MSQYPLPAEAFVLPHLPPFLKEGDLSTILRFILHKTFFLLVKVKLKRCFFVVFSSLSLTPNTISTDPLFSPYFHISDSQHTNSWELTLRPTHLRTHNQKKMSRQKGKQGRQHRPINQPTETLLTYVLSTIQECWSMFIAFVMGLWGHSTAQPVTTTTTTTTADSIDSTETAAANDDKPTPAIKGTPGKLPFKYKPVKSGTLAYIVRHGEREDHVNPGWIPGVACGSAGTAPGCALSVDDPPLSKGGLLQARETASFFKEMKNTARPVAVVCSPFIRTLQTGGEIAEKMRVPLLVEPGLSEYTCKRSFKGQPKLGCWGREGAEEMLVGKWLCREYTPMEGAPVFPEKDASAAARFERVVTGIVDANPHCALVFVTHRFGVQTLIDVLCSQVLAGARLPQPVYCSITTLERREETKRSSKDKSWKYHHIAYNEHLSESNCLYFKH